MDETLKVCSHGTPIEYECVKCYIDKLNNNVEKLGLYDQIQHELEKIKVRISKLESKNNKKTTGLTFEEAMIYLKSRKRIKRKVWIAGALFCSDHSHISTNDIMQNDWEVVE